MRQNRWLVPFLALVTVTSVVIVTMPRGSAQEPAAEKSAPATVTVTEGPFAVKLSLEGHFEAVNAEPIALYLQAYGPPHGNGPILVESVIDHGSLVKKGDPLVTFNTESIDKQITDLTEQVRLETLGVALNEKELEFLEKSVPLELADAERTRRIAAEDLKKFLDEDRDFAKRSAEESVKSSEDYLDYAQDELDQLEKMYKASDLTEETEEIILKRQRRAVQSAKFNLERTKKNRADTLNIELPRKDERLREEAKRTALTLEKANATLPPSIDRKKLELTKAQGELDRNQQKLAKLQTDRQSLEVKAPFDGILYHGRWQNGKWQTAEAAGAKLHRGGTVPPSQAFLTVVDPSSLLVRATIEEKNLHLVKPGADAKVVPTGRPGVSLNAKLQKISLIPTEPGKFEAIFAVVLPEGANLKPGMAVSVKLTPYAKRDALTLPKSAVFHDEIDEDQRYVLVPGALRPSRREVKLGHEAGDRVEILEGLADGDKVLKEKP